MVIKPGCCRKELTMFTIIKKNIMIGTIAVILLAVAGLAWTDTGALQIKQKEGIGNYLADSRGMTLYHFLADSPGRNACTGPCLERWPIFYSEKIIAPTGVDQKEFGEFTREDGKKQSTFKGWPLYYFSGDKKPGDITGHGIKDVWFIIDPATVTPYLK
jgi:predicted lipoprotein with Yx(FWY)xxD motif